MRPGRGGKESLGSNTGVVGTKPMRALQACLPPSAALNRTASSPKGPQIDIRLVLPVRVLVLQCASYLVVACPVHQVVHHQALKHAVLTGSVCSTTQPRQHSSKPSPAATASSACHKPHTTRRLASR